MESVTDIPHYIIHFLVAVMGLTWAGIQLYVYNSGVELISYIWVLCGFVIGLLVVTSDYTTEATTLNNRNRLGILMVIIFLGAFLAYAMNTSIVSHGTIISSVVGLAIAALVVPWWFLWR